MNTVPQLRLSAFSHRQWYAPGDTVRFQVYLECAREVDWSKKNLFAPPPPVPLLNYFSVDDTFESSEDSDLCVQRLSAAVAGHCRANPNVLTYDWGTVPLELHPPRSAALRSSTRASSDDDSESIHHELFASKAAPIAERVYLRARQCCAYQFSFRLPDNCPSTLSLEEFGMSVEVYLNATWARCGKESGAGASPQQTRMSIPVRVYNADTAISHFSFAAAFPFAHDAQLVRSNFEFLSVALPAVPSPAVSAPLEDSLHPSEAQIRGLDSAFRDALATRQDQLVQLRESVTAVIPVGEEAHALEVRLLASFVSIGESVRGVLVNRLLPQGNAYASGSPSAADNEDDHEATSSPVLVRASGTLEMLECCPIPVASERVPYQTVHGVDGVALLHTYPLCVQEWVLLDSPCTPFSFPLTHDSVWPTTLTDLGIVLWQLRIKVHWTTQAALAKSTERGADTLTMCTTGPEMVIPVTVVPPPRVLTHARRGHVYTTFFAS